MRTFTRAIGENHPTVRAHRNSVTPADTDAAVGVNYPNQIIALKETLTFDWYSYRLRRALSWHWSCDEKHKLDGGVSLLKHTTLL